MSQISLQNQGGQCLLTLEREAIHNAFDAALIAELCDTISALARDEGCRVLVLTGRGLSFSAGADLNWMKSQLGATEQDNLRDAKQLAQLMRTLAFFPKPTLARVNGPAYGGGVGLIACCDIAVSVDTARFGLTESKLGLVPAVISPYVMDAIGTRQAMRYFQTGELFDANRALSLGLVHEVVTSSQLDGKIMELVKHLMVASPKALRAAKQLVHHVSNHSIEEQMLLDEENAQLIARLRVSQEGQEGLSAFLAKRKPNWIAS